MTVIAMTRELGSRGSEVAAGIARTLKLKIVHSEIVASQIAERLGVERGAVRRYADGQASLLERWTIDRRKFRRYTCEEILRLAQNGNVLIRGWGAATLLRDRPVISIRVCAPVDFRVKVMMDRLGSTDAAAVRQEIERFDAAHARAMRATFAIDAEDPLLYHVVLNTQRLSVEACVAAACTLARQFRDTWTARSTLANRLLEAEIDSALADEIGLGMAPTGVQVSAKNGDVTLIATSSSGHLRAKAEKVASGIAGVRRIDNRIVSFPTRGSRAAEISDQH